MYLAISGSEQDGICLSSKKKLTKQGMTSDALESQKVAFYRFFHLNLA